MVGGDGATLGWKESPTWSKWWCCVDHENRQVGQLIHTATNALDTQPGVEKNGAF
jgi:hypothetical protein